MYKSVMFMLLLGLLSACNPTFNVGFNSMPKSLAEVQGGDPEYTKTVYPIVLVHGLYGFKDIFGINYFYLVPEALELGGAEVYTVSVSGLNSSTERGEQLLAKVYDILAISGADKVHLMGHSHGGPTTRYVASVDPSVVASVTTLHGVNDGGSETADAISEALHDPFFGIFWQTTFNALAVLIDFVAQDFHAQSAVKSFDSLSNEGMAKFNALHPQGLPNTYCGEGDYTVNGVHYFSWGGNKIRTNDLDPLDWLMAASGDQVPETSDGMVAQCKQHLGQVIRDDYHHNHLDVMNWTVGLRKAGSANPLVLYRNQVNRLKLLGL